MIEYYFSLADECISLDYWKKTHNNMLSTLETMKDKLNQLKGEKCYERKA